MARSTDASRMAETELRGLARFLSSERSSGGLGISPVSDHHALFDLYDRMLGDIEIPAVLRDVADVVCRELQAERASVYLVNRATQELESVAVIGNVARMIRVPIAAESLAGFCALTGRAFVVPDAYGDLSAIDRRLRFDGRWDEMNHFRTRDVLCAPALFKGKVLGVVQAINSRSKPFDEGDLSVLRVISRLVGYALHHARLYDDLATMKELEKRKAQFMRVMVHELKSPVTGAKMMADALQFDASVANTTAARMTERISARMGRLLELIGDLLQLANVKSGEALGEVAILDLGAETERVAGPYGEQAEQKGLEFVLESPVEAVAVRMDRQSLGLVISNLISNAVKYTAEGAVQVTVCAAPPWALLEVRDTGIGVPEGDVPRLFGEFFRASNARKAKIEGTGVGLAGVKNLVERFDGQLTLETRENEGSTFRVCLPLHAEGQARLQITEYRL